MDGCVWVSDSPRMVNNTYDTNFKRSSEIFCSQEHLKLQKTCHTTTHLNYWYSLNYSNIVFLALYLNYSAFYSWTLAPSHWTRFLLKFPLAWSWCYLQADLLIKLNSSDQSKYVNNYRNSIIILIKVVISAHCNKICFTDLWGSLDHAFRILALNTSEVINIHLFFCVSCEYY